jgi:predicted transposase/invertase (TIGR01784 family)
MTLLKYRFTNDVLFKTVLGKEEEVLKRLVAAVLEVSVNELEEFQVINPELPPEEHIEDKLLRLDINMLMRGRRVNLEVQVVDEKNYRERSLFNWARQFSSALLAGHGYVELPQVICINILEFNLFDWKEFRSEFRIFDTEHYEVLSDKFGIHFFELPKLPKTVNVNSSELVLLLALFHAKTEEELKHLNSLGVKSVTQLVESYRRVTVSEEFRDLERRRETTRHDLDNALYTARKEGAQEEREKWEQVTAELRAGFTAELAKRDAELARLQAGDDASG